MFAALKPLLTSKKFLTAVITVIANLLLFFGIELDADQAVALTSPLIAAIVGQTVVDVKKAGAATTALILLLVIGVCAGAVVSSGCATAADTGKQAASGFVDCMKPEAKGAALELAPAFLDILENAIGNDGRIDWAPVRSVAGALTSDATRCAFTTAIALAMQPHALGAEAPQSAELAADPADVRAGFEAIRAELYGGTRFKLESGIL
jgi:hypothetical protein